MSVESTSFTQLIPGFIGNLVSRSISTMMFADGSWEGEIKEREGGDARTSATTSDTEITRNPHQPEGWRRDGNQFLCRFSSTMSLTSRRRRFANSTPSRSPQTSPYLWNETLREGQLITYTFRLIRFLLLFAVLGGMAISAGQGTRSLGAYRYCYRRSLGTE